MLWVYKLEANSNFKSASNWRQGTRLTQKEVMIASALIPTGFVPSRIEHPRSGASSLDESTDESMLRALDICMLRT